MGVSPKPRGNVVNYYLGSETEQFDKTGDDKWTSIVVTNDGSADIVLSVNNIDMTIKAGETLDEDFVDFDTFEITAVATAYRVFVRE